MYKEIGEATAGETIAAAWDAGIRYFDTAPLYGSGISEHRFGHSLREYPRDDFVLSTKVGRRLYPDVTKGGETGPFVKGLPFRVEYDYTADGVRRQLEDSLQRLGMARIDIVYIHDIAEDTHGPRWREVFDDAMKGAAVALAQLRDEGVIQAWGLGVNRIEACLRALDQEEPDVFLIAGRYSLLNTPALDELSPRCIQRGIHVVVGGPYNSGIIAGGSTYEYGQASPDQVAARDHLQTIADQFKIDLRAAALQFCAAHPAVSSVIPGTSQPKRVIENVELMKQSIPAEFWQRLKDDALIPRTAPTPSLSHRDT
jgi:D-threo-aldose 1-dehydrogenase